MSAIGFASPKSVAVCEVLTSLLFPPLPLSFLSLPLPLEVGPLNAARRFGGAL